LDARRKKENVRICYERFVVFVMVLFLCQMIELSHAANPTHAIAAPINANIYFLLSFFDLPMFIQTVVFRIFRVIF